MCGICGFLELNHATPTELAEEHLLKMCREMKHRGPDDQGVYAPGTGVGLGAVRLSILDLAGGHQPLCNEDGSCWVALNGEIYNFPRLRPELEREGHTFRTHCDTEAVVHAYEQWGDDCVNHLDGMFAFAIWDANRKRLFVARDRLGKKPLYYWFDGRTFVFSSEIKSLRTHPAVDPRLDPEALDVFMTFGYIPGPMTVFKDIHKLQPGNILTLDEAGAVVCRQYWDLPEVDPVEAERVDEKQAEQQVLRLLEESVQARLLADVPVGVFLSGGLDSSVVTALMKRHKPDLLKSFSVSFRDPEQNEAPFAQAVADYLGTEHYELATNNCSPDLIQKLVWHCDEPLADPAIVPTYLVSKLAREQVTVVLTGEGADELFAGYFYYPLERRAAGYDWMPTWAKQHLLVSSARAANRLLNRQRYHPRTLWSWQMRPEERMLAWMSIFTDAEKQRWFTPAANTLAAKGISARHLDNVSRPYTREKWFSNFAYIDMKVPLVDDLLMKVDKMSMAASLEARCPFLDHHLVEYAAGLPESLKLRNGANKLILRRVAADLLPEKITNRTKHGFDVPLQRWLTEDLREFFWDLVTGREFDSLQIINKAQVEDIWSEMERGVQSRTRQVWNILILAAWFHGISA
jgi:asparagine synthase (glutamine-hydrolysing)